MNTDNVASLFEQPIPEKLNRVGQPELTSLVLERRQEDSGYTPDTSSRLPYMTYDDVSDTDVYDPTDFHTVGNKIRNNVAAAITARFPVVGDKYTLTIENLAYEKPKARRLADEKAILQQGKSLTDKLRGDWVLRDTATGEEIERKSATILNVPRMTSRGTFIRNGSEVGLKHMFRLRPGVYARVKADGTPSVHINPAQTTGRQMSLNLDQETGVMTISRGTRNFGVLPLLIAAGVSEDTLKSAWGTEVFDLNKNKYARLLLNPDSAQFKEYKELWSEGFEPIRLDPETTQRTMGRPYDRMNSEVLLEASNKALKLSRTMSTEDEDDRDSLAYQRVMGPADYIPERIIRDGGGLLRKLFQRVTRDGNLNIIEAGAFQPQVDSVFMEDRHAGYIDGASPFEGLDYASSVSRIGEGGIGDVKAAPAETRGVNDSYLGFIDPIRSPECYVAGSQLKTKYGWKNVEDITMDDELACLVNGRLEYHTPIAINIHEYTGPMYGYDSKTIAYKVTPNHRMFTCSSASDCSRSIDSFSFREASDIHLKIRTVMCGGHAPIAGNEDLRVFRLPITAANLKSEQVYGNPPLGANLRNVTDVDIDDFAEFMGWYLSEGCCVIDEVRGYYRVEINQCFDANPDNYRAIRKLLRRLPFNAYSGETDEMVDNTEYTGEKSLCVGSKQLTMYCAQFGKSGEKYIPDWIFTAPLSSRIRFRDAMLKGDARDNSHYTSKSKRLADDFARLQFELGESIKLNYEPEKRYDNHPGTWVAYKHSRKFRTLVKGGENGRESRKHRGFYIDENFSGKVYCPTVPGGLVFYRSSSEHIGFWCGNSLKVGLEVYLTYGVRKDSKGNLYANFIDKSGKEGLRRMSDTASAIVATPEFYNPAADPEEFIPAIYKGKGVEYVQRKDVDYYLASSNNMMSTGAGMIPNIGGIRSNRTLMGCLHPDTLLDIVRGDSTITLTAGLYLNEFEAGDKVACLNDEYTGVELRDIRGVVKVDNPSRKVVCISTATQEAAACVTMEHKCLVSDGNGNTKLIKACDMSVGYSVPVAVMQFDVTDKLTARWVGFEWEPVTSVVIKETAEDYAIDLDVNDSVYVLHSGIFTHNSKYPLQALSLSSREAPLVQRKLTVDGVDTTTEKAVAKQLGAKFAPADGRVVSIDADTITIKDREGNKHIVDLYNMYPANQKGYLHNTPTVSVGDRVSANQLIADSNYTRDGAGALGTNLKVAFMTGHGSELFEDAIVISESCAKNKLASEQLYKFRGDLTADTDYDKSRFMQLFGSAEYTQEQLDKIDDNGMPKVGVKFSKGDPVFLGIQTRDLSTSGLSRNAAVPYVKTWEHDTEGEVVDVVRGRKHMTIYTRSFTPMQLGDKMCYDDKTEIMTKRGWILFQDLLADDEVLTLDIQTGENYFTPYTAAFKYQCKKELLYRLTTKRLDIATTIKHNHLISPVNCGRYLTFQTSEQIYGKLRYFLTNCNLESQYSYACSREDEPKERWEKYTGWVYCVNVEPTNTVFVRRNGKSVWSGNSGRYGDKSVVSTILPDDEMPRDANGVPYDAIKSPLSLPSRLNTAMLGEVQLAKVAKHTGKPVVVPDFITDDTIDSFVAKQLKKYGISDTTTVFDPRSNKYIEGVTDGYMFHYKLKHMSELKERGRGTGIYSSEGVPLKGEGAARRLGMMETSAVYSSGGLDVLRDAKLIRGQRNDEFWRDYRDGKHPEIPGTPLVHKKFFAHLVASGASIERNNDGFRLSAATDEDIKELTSNREVTRAATFDSKNMQPVAGGLFDPVTFGADGDQWGYFQLPEPILNPLMFKPVASILGWSDTELREYLQGSRSIDGQVGPEAVINLLNSVDLKSELKKAKVLLKSGTGTLQQRDLARKRIRAISPLLRDNLKPSDLFFTRMPILPPRFRTVSVIQGGETNIAADVNFLYKRMMDAAADLTAAKKDLPGEYQVDARKGYYDAINAVVGLMPTDDPKLEAKGVAGLLKWAFGKGSPKLSAVHRKVFGANLDMGGLGTIIPDSRLTIDQVGIPEESAWSMYEPFVVRELRQRGYSMVDAMRRVVERHPEARQELLRVMSKRPVLVNRAPTLWRYGIQGMYPVIVEGKAIRVNPNICKSYNADFDGNCCDFDSKIFVKFSKSAFDKLYKRDCIISNANNNQQEDNMSVTKNSIVTVKQEVGNVSMMSIGEFPKVGEPIKDKNGADVYGLMSGVEVMSVNPVTGEVSFNQATSFTEEHDCECVEITVGGRTATVSTNATLAVFDPTAGKLVKVAAEDHQNRLIPLLKKLPLHSGTQYNRDFGWWIGALISDGWISDRMVGYTKLEECKRKEFARIARSIHENFTLNEYASKETDDKLGKSVKLHLCGKEFAEICKSYGIYDEDSTVDGRSTLRKQIPYDMILNGSEEFLWGLLSGLLDGDGSFAKNTTMKTARFSCRLSTSSPSLRETFEFLLYRLGIRYSTTVTPPRNWSNEAYSISPSTVDMYPILHKLSCVGERESSLIAEWKEHAPAQDNTDIIPISEDELQKLRKAGLASYDKTLYAALGKPARSVSRALAKKHMGFIQDLAPEFSARVLNDNTIWRPVSKIVNVGKREVYDFAIPDTKVFVINAGVTIYDSMTTHVPVSQTAIDAIDKYMLPSRNLISPKDFKAHFIPRDAANEGLYLASRIGKGSPKRFKSAAEARVAYKRGEIKVDTPIIIG